MYACTHRKSQMMKLLPSLKKSFFSIFYSVTQTICIIQDNSIQGNLSQSQSHNYSLAKIDKKQLMITMLRLNSIKIYVLTNLDISIIFADIFICMPYAYREIQKKIGISEYINCFAISQVS